MNDLIKSEYEKAIDAAKAARSNLQERIGTTTNDTERQKLVEKSTELASKIAELTALSLKEVLDSPEVKNALQTLRGATASLNKTAEEMKTTTKTIETAAKIIGLVASLIGLAEKIFL